MLEPVSLRKRLVQRLALVVLVGLVAIIFLSSSVLAGVIAMVTVVAVLLDTLALSRLERSAVERADAAPRQITVDLSRRS